jgi:hypothetical protein
MNKTFKLTLAILLLITAIGLYTCQFQDKGEVKEPSVNEYAVDFEEQNLKIYIGAKTWGLAGNHERITVSLSPFENNKDYLENKCLIFYTSQVYYKKQGRDTLLLYVAASAVPKKSKVLTSSINIIQVELANYDEIQDYELNYKKHGLSKASVYKR